MNPWERRHLVGAWWLSAPSPVDRVSALPKGGAWKKLVIDCSSENAATWMTQNLNK